MNIYMDARSTGEANLQPAAAKRRHIELNIRRLGCLVAFGMLIPLGVSTLAQPPGVVTGKNNTYMNPLQVALKAWYPANEVVGFSGSPYNFNQPGSLTFDGSNIYVANQGNGQILKIRASDGRLVGTFATTADPGAMAFDGHRIRVANHSLINPHNTVTIFDAATAAQVRTLSLGDNPNGMVWDGWGMWAATEGGNVYRIDNWGGTYCHRPVDESRAYGVAFDGNYTWVTAIDANAVWAFDYQCNPVTAVLVKGGPVGIVFDGTSLWTANVNNNTVARIKPNGQVTEFAVGSRPWQVAFDGAFIWVTNTSGNSVTKIPVNTVDGKDAVTIDPCTNAPQPKGPLDLAFDGANMWVTCLASNSVGKM